MRGYNQATEFAYGLSLSLGIPVLEYVLVREIMTISQTHK